MRQKHVENIAHKRRHQILLQGDPRRPSWMSGWDRGSLQARLNRCGRYESYGQFRCRSPACPACRDRYIADQRRAASTRFGGANNTDLAFVSIVLGASDNVRDIAEIVTKFRSDLRNVINRKRRSSPKWKDLDFLAWLETDCFDASDLGHLGSDKKSQYDSFLKIYAEQTGPIWVPTVHGIIRIPASMDFGMLQEVFSHQWQAHNQVDIKPFFQDKSLSWNITDVVNYALKHECITRIYDKEAEWEPSWVYEYYNWLHEWSRGSLRLKFSVKPSKGISNMRSNKKDTIYPTNFKMEYTFSGDFDTIEYHKMDDGINVSDTYILTGSFTEYEPKDKSNEPKVGEE